MFPWAGLPYFVGMWRISIQDLRHRRRRFVLAVVATGLAFGMSLLMQGFVTTLGWESRHIVGLFGADEWVVAAGGTGPFTTMTFIDASVVDEFRSQPGVRAAGAFVQAREILHGLDTFVIGVESGGLGVPVAADGRAPTAPGEVMTATMLGYHLGDEIQLAGRSATVVGTVADGTYYFGQPVVFALLSDVQDRYLAGQRIANGVAVSGTIEPPAGMRVLTNRQAIADIDRPQKSGRQSVEILNGLLWIMAAGIVATMVYLIALERTRDVAVMKAMGVASRTLFGSVALHGLVLSIAALVVGVAAAFLLAPIFPFTMRLEAIAVAKVGLIAIAIGLLASLFGYRRAAGVDPAVAFGRSA
jgi:putative ABC transport system permease protein